MLSEKLKENRQNLSQWLRSFDWEQTREKVQQESRARILVTGLSGAGKSTLFNQLCGWAVSPAGGSVMAEEAGPLPNEPIEDYGLFCLADLPPTASSYPGGVGLVEERPLNGHAGPGQQWEELYGFGLGLEGALPLTALDPLTLAEGADLILYVLDGAVGVQAADYRWVGRLRRLGVPLLVALNKSDCLGPGLASRRAEVEARLGTTVLPVSALEGPQLADHLLPKIIDLCPELTVALGRELHRFRRTAAERLIHQAALVNGLVALEPIPLLDLPVQVMTLAGVMLRIAAVYDRPPSDVRRREVAVALLGNLAGRYGAQQVSKMIPVVGWLVSGVLAWSCTWGLGRAAVAYFEAGGDGVIDRGWSQTRIKMSRISQMVSGRWAQRARLRLGWPSGHADEVRDENVETNT